MQMDLRTLIPVAMGDEPADLLLANTRIVNVFTGEVGSGNIAIKDGYIVGIGDYKAAIVEDMENRYAAPGFIDAHVHIESAMVGITEFALTVSPFGTTAVITDPHEIANVMGIDGIRYMMQCAENQPMDIFFVLPSCVPATGMETSGAIINAHDLSPFFRHPRVVGLAEMMNYPGVVGMDEQVLQKLDLPKKFKKTADGHSPGLSAKALNAYILAGVSNDHECTSLEEAKEKMAAGMMIMVREGTGAKNLKDLLPLVDTRTFHRMMWCTDDRHPHDLAVGHVDSIIRDAVGRGLDPVIAIQMATINPAQHYGISDLGAIAPGKKANIVIFSDLLDLKAEAVYFNGKKIAENGKMLEHVEKPHDVPVSGTMHVDPGSLDFSIYAPSNRIHLIDLVENQIITRHHIADVAVLNGMAISDISTDILKCAVIERHGKTGRIGKGFVRGFGLKQGALASSVAHDSHNIIAVGTNDADIKAAVLQVIETGGGIAAAKDGEVRASLALPIAGLMSTSSIVSVCRQLDKLLKVCRDFGARLSDPFMTLSFLALPVIPELKITDMGLVDVNAFEIIPLFVP